MIIKTGFVWFLEIYHFKIFWKFNDYSNLDITSQFSIILFAIHVMSSNNRLEESLAKIIALRQLHPEVVSDVKQNLIRLIYRLQNIEFDLDKQTTIERLKLLKRIQNRNSDVKSSAAFKKIQKLGWDKLNQKELRSIAQVLSKKSGISLDREAKRRREILLTWFDENYDQISEHMDRIVLEYDPLFV